METLFNPKNHHGDIAEIQKYMDLSPLAPETLERQAGMAKLWSTQSDAFYERLFFSQERLIGWKVPLLSKLVDWAYTTTPFYKKLYDQVGFKPGDIRSLEDFERLPSISKDDVIKGFPIGLPSREFDLTKCRWMSTSGSSGKTVQIVLPQERADLDILFKYRMFEFMGGFRLDPKKWLYNIHYVLWWHSSINGDLPVFSVTQDCSPEPIYQHIASLRPQVVSSIGSYLEKLASLDQRLDTHGVRIVSTNSETTSRQERERWSEIFQVPVRDEYSSEELDIMAMECPYHKYHVVEDDAHFEILNPDSDGLGEVVGTDLWNYAMPMIRYRQNDLAAWDESQVPCLCGSGFRRLKGLHGRADQALLSRVRGKVAPGSLLDAVEIYFCAEDSGIAEFRVIQTDFEAVTILYVGKKNTAANPKTFVNFQKHLQELFGHNVMVTPEEVTTIPQSASYKRRTILNRMSV